jgi:hypothetical protein
MLCHQLFLFLYYYHIVMLVPFAAYYAEAAWGFGISADYDISATFASHFSPPFLKHYRLSLQIKNLQW